MFLKIHNLIDYSLLLVIETSKGMSEHDVDSQINQTLIGAAEFDFGSFGAQLPTNSKKEDGEPAAVSPGN